MTEWEQIKMETQLNNLKTYAEILQETALSYVQLEAQRLQKMAENLGRVMPMSQQNSKGDKGSNNNV